MQVYILASLVVAVFGIDHQCPPHQHYSHCGSNCPVTCGNRADPPECGDSICFSGCECDDGYLRQHGSFSGPCVPPDQCPPPVICPPYEHFTRCGTDCPVTCANRDNPPKCDGDICFEGCLCNDGYLRQYSKYIGECVKPEDCPSPGQYRSLRPAVAAAAAATANSTTNQK